MSRKLRRSEKLLVLVALASAAPYAAAALLDVERYFPSRMPLYSALHTVLEVGSILICFSILAVNWEGSKLSRNARSLFVATGFLTVAAVDTMHFLSYSGMPNFVTPNGPDKAIYYWLFARLWAASVLLASAWVQPGATGRFLRRRFLLGSNLVACGLVFVVVALFHPLLPSVREAETGSLPLRDVIEYLVIGLCAVGVVAHLRAHRSTGDESLVLVAAALVVSLFVEIPALFDWHVYDVYDFLGHLYKICAYYLVFRGLLLTSLQRPYFQLRVAKDELEQTVARLDASNRELDALYGVAVTLSSSLKPDRVLESAVEKVVQVMGAESGAVFLLEEGSDRTRLAAWRGLSEDAVSRCAGERWRIPHGVLSHGSGSAEATALEDPSLVRSLGGIPARIAPLRVCACAPITSRGAFLGTLAVVAGRERAFAPQDADLLTAIGYQLGLAIENARLYERTDERLRENLDELQGAERRARFLSEVGGVFGSSMELREMLELVARKTTEVMGDWCALYLLNEHERLLRLEAVHHADEELAQIRSVLMKRPLRLGEGLVGRVAQLGQAVLISRLSTEVFAREARYLAQSVDEIAILRKAAPTSAIVAPLRARGQTVGVLVILATHSMESFGDAELSLARELADRAGVTIQNSQLFQENLAQRRHLEAIISQMVDGVVIADPEGRLLVVNASAQKMLGERTDQLVGGQKRWPRSRGKPAGKTAVPATSLVNRALSGELVTGEEITVTDGAEERVLSASASPIRDESDQITGAAVVLRDVTSEREVDRIKDEFVATVSHELRTPITAVLGYTDMLLRGLRGPLEPRQLDALGSVRAAGHRLLALINDLLDISRLEAGKQEIALQAVDLAESAERALSAVSVLASAKGIQLVRSIPDGLPSVLADDEQVQRILGNLLSNAIKFTPEGGMVSLTAAATGSEIGPAASRQGAGGFVSVTVSDTGIGIPEEKQGRIWEKFQQGDSSSRRLYGGTGLGLAITKGLVDLQGGRVWVESEGIPGKGSRFTFTLPVAGDGDQGTGDRGSEGGS